MSESTTELTLTTGPAANGGSCVARHDGRVVFVRYALPGETVRVRVRAERGSYWHADVVEVLEASPDRVEELCPIAGVDGAGCCDLAFAAPEAARRIKGEVVANQLGRLGGYEWSGAAEQVGAVGSTGWRTRVRLDVSASGHAGFHRYHSTELYPELNCGQLAPGLVDGVDGSRWPPGAQLHIAVDDDGVRHIVQTGPAKQTQVVEGQYEALQRIGDREWHVPVTAFWQAHRDAPEVYSALIRDAARLEPGMTAWDLYGGAGVFAAALATEVGETGQVLTVDTSRGSARAARTALADMPWVSVVTDSVRRALTGRRDSADVAVLDPPRTGAGREIIDLIAGVPRVIHIGCEAASFARDVGEYLRHGYTVEQLRVFDAFPLTHHVECVAVLTR
ncbi:class I SAM-dependent RNA methyltransferase [Mycobacterium hackensackense]|uniref:class I SAM-dependent RNA methyltransferase n=1 Tax=Mycobacterium hackensackense TaxID=228909 RepID=UPI002265C247|nr:TRAM domain-containing protein [Mycobacterium hackensackense]